MTSRRNLADLLRSDISAWNALRSSEPDAVVDLSAVRLDLCNLRGANLAGTCLRGANLREADLRDADLSRAILEDADLAGAKLSGSTLRGARLSFARLTGADARRVDFRTARLRGADLRGAQLERSNFQGADLCDARIFQDALTILVAGGANPENVRFESPVSDSAGPAPESDNWFHLLWRRGSLRLPPATGRPRATRPAILFGVYAGLAGAVFAAYETFQSLAGAETWIQVFVPVLVLIPVALIPQIAYAIPARFIPGVSILLIFLVGILTGAGFALLTAILEPVVVAQTLALLGVSMLWTPALDALKLLRGPPQRAAVPVIAVTALTAWLGARFLGTPWMVPLLAGEVSFEVPSSGADWLSWIARSLALAAPTAFIVIVIGAGSIQAVIDWNLIQRRVRAGIARAAVPVAAAIYVGSAPMLIVFFLSFLSGRSRQSRGPESADSVP